MPLPQQATAHRFLNEFQLWRIRQLENVADELAKTFGEAFRQDIVVLDIDSTTHSLESRKRQKAVLSATIKRPLENPAISGQWDSSGEKLSLISSMQEIPPARTI